MRKMSTGSVENCRIRILLRAKIKRVSSHEKDMYSHEIIDLYQLT